MSAYGEDVVEARARLEREAMAWPPETWERPASAWRDDLWVGPDPFLPYDGPAAEAVAPKRATGYSTLAREFVETIVLTALIFLGIRLVVQNFRIEGRSMEPNLHTGQYLLVNKLAYHGFGQPQRGDIVVFQAWEQEKDFIKRIVGLPGDEVEIHDGAVYVNETPLDEPYLDQPTADNVGPIRLTEDQYYVMGDNRGNSSDSRTYGPLPADRVVGKAWLTYWPPNAIGVIPDRGQSFASSR